MRVHLFAKKELLMQNQKAQTAIVRIEDTNGRFLEQGAETTDSTLILSGTGKPFDQVVIKDEGDSLKRAPWTVQETGKRKFSITK